MSTLARHLGHRKVYIKGCVRGVEIRVMAFSLDGRYPIEGLKWFPLTESMPQVQTVSGYLYMPENPWGRMPDGYMTWFAMIVRVNSLATATVEVFENFDVLMKRAHLGIIRTDLTQSPFTGTPQ